MRTVGRLSIIALTVIIAAAALAAGERANAPAAPVAVRETSVSPAATLFPPWPDPEQSAAEPNPAERQKTFAWLLLLLKEHRGAR